MLYFKSSVLILVFLLFFLPYGFMPLTSSQPNSYEEISFQPNSIPLVNLYYEDYSFVFSYKQFFMRISPFIIYNNNYYGLRAIVQYLRNNYPNIDYRWLVSKAERAIHYGFNLTKLPQTIADKIDYLGFRLVDLNFPLSWFELEHVDSTVILGYNHTRIHIPRANLVFSFEDLYPYGYSVEHINSTYILIGNVNGETDLYVDPITFSSNLITVTGYSLGTPCTFTDIYNADIANGWNVTFLQGDNQFLFDARIYVNMSSYLADTNKQIVFSNNALSANGQYYLIIHATGYFRSGILLDATQKSTWKGCMFKFEDSSYGRFGNVVAGCLLYSSYFVSINADTFLRSGKIYNCFLSDYMDVESMASGGEIYNMQSIAARRGTRGFINVDIEKLTTIRCYYGIFIYGTANFTVNDVYARFNTYPLYLSWMNGNVSIIDWNSDVYSCTGDHSTGEAYRQYSFDLTVTYENGTVINGTATNSTVLIRHYGENSGIDYNGTLSENGTISTQTFTMGFYNLTGLGTIYDYNPYNITIISGDYRYSTNFTLEQKTDWTITLSAGAGGVLTPLMIALVIIGCIVVFGVCIAMKQQK